MIQEVSVNCIKCDQKLTENKESKIIKKKKIKNETQISKQNGHKQILVSTALRVKRSFIFPYIQMKHLLR